MNMPAGQFPQGLQPMTTAALPPPLLPIFHPAFAGGPPQSAPGPASAARDIFIRTPNSAGVKIVCLGDIHGRWRKIQQILDHEFPMGNGLALSVGDLAGYPQLENGHRLLFTPGNHEDFGAVNELREGSSDKSQFTPILAGDTATIGGLRVAGIQGIHELKHFREAGAHPMYMTEGMVDRMLSLNRLINILLMHEPPSGINFELKGCGDVGVSYLRGIIEFLKPQLALFGHHHRSFFATIDKTMVMGLDYPHRQYSVIEYSPDSESFTVWNKVAKLFPGNIGYQFGWQYGNSEGDVVNITNRRLAVGRKGEIEKTLNDRHFEALHAKIKAKLVDELQRQKRHSPDQIADAADMRASIALNAAIPHAAAFASSVEGKALQDEEMRKIAEGIFENISRVVKTELLADTLYAYQECLIALGLVKEEPTDH